MKLLYEIFFSVVTGFIGSFLVVMFLYRLKPKIEISPYIAEQPIPNSSQKVYGFKIINRTPYPVIDIQMELVLVSPINVPGGSVKAARAIPLLRDNFFQLAKFDPKDKEANYALRVGCEQDIRSIWVNDSQDLRLNVIAKHAMSGFSVIRSHVFHTRADIRPGKHAFGNDLRVGPVV
jgi:hypothetical protein